VKLAAVYDYVKRHGYRNTHLVLSSSVTTTLVGTALCVFPTQVLMRSDDSYNTDIISVRSIPWLVFIMEANRVLYEART